MTDNKLEADSHGKKDIKNKDTTNIKTEPKKAKGYDSKSRNPQYSGAEGSCLWEITELFDHYHPSVSHFANSICQVSNCCITLFTETISVLIYNFQNIFLSITFWCII